MNPDAQEAVEWLLRVAAEQTSGLEYRSTWYRLVAAIPKSALGTLTRPTLLDCVNGIYNEAISRTLSCDPDIAFSDGRIVRAATEAGLKGQWGNRAVELAQAEAVQDVMSLEYGP